MSEGLTVKEATARLRACGWQYVGHGWEWFARLNQEPFSCAVAPGRLVHIVTGQTVRNARLRLVEFVEGLGER